MAENTVNWIVVQNASKIWLWYLLNSSTSADDRLGLVDLRRLGSGDASWPEVLVPSCFPSPVLLHRRDRVVDLGLQLGVALLQTDAVALLRERPADDLECTWSLRGIASQDRLVGGHRVDRAVLECLNARRVGVVLLQLHARILVLDALGRR